MITNGVYLLMHSSRGFFFSKIFFLLGICVLLSFGAEKSFAVSYTAAQIKKMVPHKALYDIDLVATHSGSQIINISGLMYYEWKPVCDAWVTDHRFNLQYEYADTPSVQVISDFSTYESFTGSSFDFSSRRRRNGELYEELRGYAQTDKDGGEAIYNAPDGLVYTLPEDTHFPMGHTLSIMKHAQEGKNFFRSTVFDGSDQDGPISISAFIGKKINPLKEISPSSDIEMSLVNTPAWNVRMAVFPLSNPREDSDYEMSMVFHDNGVISTMLVEYEDFSIEQKLVALEKVDAEKCEAPQ